MSKIKKYIGIAENKKDITSAISLINKIFNEDNYKGISFLPDHSLRKKNLVVIKLNELLIATCFIHNRIFYFKGDRIKASFLCYICVDINYRGKGFSKDLMNKAIEICEKRNRIVSFVIARKKADYFYNKFSFFGFSNYPVFKVKDLNKKPISNILFEEMNRDSIPIVEKIFDDVYKSLPGSFLRKEKDWKFILKKAKLLNVKLNIILDGNNIIGYIAFKEDQIFEFALKENIDYENVIINYYTNKDYKSLTFSLGINHPLISYLKDYDTSFIIRKCWYGGHMMRINKEDFFINKLEDQYSKKYFQLKQNFSKKRKFDFYLENDFNENFFSKKTIYNIPLMDQI